MTKQKTQEYRIRRAKAVPELKGLWDGPAWKVADTLDIANVRPESSDHRPNTQARLLYSSVGLHGIFRVQDRYVRCLQTEYQSSVCTDSCVEFFFQPLGKTPYFNFEFNCGGALLCYWIEDSSHSPQGGFNKYTILPVEDLKQVGIYHSMPRVVDPEIPEPTVWFLEFFIPRALIEKYAGPVGEFAGQKWRANFYKCGSLHEHWISWSPVDKLNFHLPHCFAPIVFEG